MGNCIHCGFFFIFTTPCEALAKPSMQTSILTPCMIRTGLLQAVFQQWLNAHGGVILNITATLHLTGAKIESLP